MLQLSPIMILTRSTVCVVRTPTSSCWDWPLTSPTSPSFARSSSPTNPGAATSAVRKVSQTFTERDSDISMGIVPWHLILVVGILANFQLLIQGASIKSVPDRIKMFFNFVSTTSNLNGSPVCFY